MFGGCKANTNSIGITETFMYGIHIGEYRKNIYSVNETDKIINNSIWENYDIDFTWFRIGNSVSESM